MDVAGAVVVEVQVSGILAVVLVQLIVGIGELFCLIGGILVSQDGLGEDVREEGLIDELTIDHVEISGFCGVLLQAVGVQGIQVVLYDLLPLFGEGVACGLRLAAQDGNPLELGEGSFKEVVSIGGASFLVIHLLGGGEVCVIAHVDAVGRVALGLLQHVVFNVFVIVGQLRGVEALVAYGGYGTVAHQNAGVPDNQNGGDDGGNDADGPIELRFGSTGLVSV